jgi:hypothetical protein
MQIKYSEHIEKRLQLRGIENDLPKVIVEQAEERFFDNETGHLIAIMKTYLYNNIREVMVAYVMKKDYIKLLTIHPLKEGQKYNRLKSGRWRKI